MGLCHELQQEPSSNVGCLQTICTETTSQRVSKSFCVLQWDGGRKNGKVMTNWSSLGMTG